MAERDKTKAFTRLTPAEKEEVRAHWRMGTATNGELATRFNVGTATITRTVKGIKYGEKEDEIRDAADEGVTEEAVKNAKTHAERVGKVKEDAFKRADTVLRLLLREIGKAVSADTDFGSIAPDLKALKLAMEVCRMGRQEMYDILGIDPKDIDEDTIPELKFTIVSDEEIRRQADQQISVFETGEPFDFEENEKIVIGESDEDGAGPQ